MENAMSVLVNPDCLDGKHRACSGDGWCEETDQAVPCPCDCHQQVPTAMDWMLATAINMGVDPAKISAHSANLMATRNDPSRADGQHYDGCPCGTCQALRTNQPVAAAMQAKHLSGASIGKLVEWEMGRSLITGERQWSPAAMLDGVGHQEGNVNLAIDWGNRGDYDGWYAEDHELKPESWVRITQPATAGISLPEAKED